MEKYPHYNLGVCLALTGSVCSGIAYLTMRKLGSTINSAVITMYFGAFSVVFYCAMSWIMGEEIEEPIGGKAILLLSLVGLFGWLAQEGVSKAVSMAEASRMAPINYLQVILAWLADVILFG